MQISAHFKSEEFACRCGCGLDSVNLGLVAGLERLRAALGRPIRVTSGVRCAIHNARVGGVAGSYHTRGMAADIQVPGASLPEVFRAAAKVRAFGGIGAYEKQGFLHVDIRAKRARWFKD